MTLFHIGFFGWPLIVGVTIFLNWYRINVRKKTPHYFFSNWSRGVFGFICLVLMTVHLDFDPAYLYTWIPAIPSIVYIWTLFYLTFDPGLNVARKKEVDYRGKKSGWVDPILSRAMWWTLKGVCLIALVYSTIIIWRNL